MRLGSAVLIALVAAPGLGCTDGAGSTSDAGPTAAGACTITSAEAPDFVRRIGCRRDFDALASVPLDTSIPGARSVKFVLDQQGGDNLYFQNSKKFKIHWEFASRNLSGMGRPVVPSLQRFNQTEYSLPSRRFVLGSVTFYDGPNVWALELAPYDTASAAMMEKAFRAVAAATFFGGDLFFHPTSEAVLREASKLPASVPIKSTKQLYDKIDYQPLNLGSSIGRLRFVTAAELADEAYLSFRDVVVLDHVPNDLSVTLGIITEEFQTPLSHINVLAQTRKIPNMALRNAFADARLRALEGKWVRLTVRASAWTIEEAAMAEADAWWTANRPPKLTIASPDNSVTGLRDVKLAVDASRPLRDSLRAAVTAFGGKATHYAAMAQAGIVPLPEPAGFIIPVFYYSQFMQQNGFDKRVTELMAQPAFRDDPAERDRQLGGLRDAMEKAPVDADFVKLLNDKLDAGYKGLALRYRSSSTVEDVDGFAGAGLYTSETGDPASPKKTMLTAIRKVWASVWRFRGFEEREFRSVDQLAVGMAILAHPAFIDEVASGVAMTANPFDPSGLQPGFFINVQPGDASVTLPKAGVKADQFILHFDLPGQPVVFIENSSLVPEGKSVLSRRQIFDLGKALEAIHSFFRPAYGPPPDNPTAWYALEVDFKFDPRAGGEPALIIKQARPHPGRGQ